MLLQKEMKNVKTDRWKNFRERKCFLKFWKKISVKVSSCFSFKMLKGSLAVETALVLPLFFLGIVTMISFMDIYQLQTEHLTALCSRAKQAGMYAYLTGGNSVEEMTVPDIYTYHPFGGLVPLRDVRMINYVKVHTWTGKTYEKNVSDAENKTETMVYVTESGNVCHKDLGCSYLNLSINQIPGNRVAGLKNENGESYSACEICSRNQKPAGMVFVTGQGNRYHNLETCSGLKRNVRLIKESDAAGMGMCSRCG